MELEKEGLKVEEQKDKKSNKLIFSVFQCFRGKFLTEHKESNMKAFLVGLAFLILVMLIAGVGALLSVLLFPLLLVLGFALRIVLSVLLVIFAIWLLGKLIILAWNALRAK